jgi:[ribosomal protein S18]-alanine N-acetyltransferase
LISEAGRQAAIRIKPASLREIRAILRLEKECFGRDAWPLIDVLAALTFPETVRFTAYMGQNMVGFVIGDRRPSQSVGWIASICVAAACRRQGVGRRLLAACEQALDQPRLRLTLRVSNTAARQLYRLSGYADVDRWPKYYRDGEDALVMEKLIGVAVGAPPD